MKKKFFALLLAVSIVIGMLPTAAMAANNFAKTKTWDDAQFTDVAQGDWFYENVKSAYELGLMLGCGDGTFDPYGKITLAQTVAVAARIHAIAVTGEDNFVQGSPWYRVYVDYALANGILDGELADYNQQATRLDFARILAHALPAKDLKAINDVDYGDIPDVADDEAVYTLYRAGVLIGKGNGEFGPADIIDRSQMATIVTRMALPELRQQIEEEVEKEDDSASSGGNIWWPDFDWGDEEEEPSTEPSVEPSPEPSPEPEEDIKVTVPVESENDAVKTAVSLEAEDVKATVPAGVTLAEGAQELTLTVDAMESTGSDVTPGENEEMTSYDVHIDGVAEDNTVVITVALGAVLPKGLNMGNVALYHVEDGVTNAMTQVTTPDELDEHNEFYYDPATGEVTVAMATFSEVAVVANTENPWNGTRDYTWYDASKTALTIANADQLAGFGAIVGGMNRQTQDSFTGKTVKLISDVNLGDAEDANNANLIFYPIGYYNSEGTYEKTSTAITSGFYTFKGTFDGNGHTIANFYQNTWEMKGDHNWYDATLQYYRDGMGLFGKVYGGTVKNLIVENFSSDGEITTTGVIAAYADCGATFENIAIFNCNPRVYNIGNGGIVGCVGWYANDAHTTPVTFRNITVDNTNKISALWGSWDVACGGLVGQYYPTSGQESAIDNAGIYMENCHVAAQIDVYNDVCANYQYYAYRYAGMLIGSVRENETVDGHVYPKMDGITAKDCTVHFGDWNDYYYCELVANSLASYTNDHQFSRLEQVKAINGTTITYLDDTTGTVPTSGRYNYVVVNGTHATENATCYHFVDGAVWTHEQGGYETTDVTGDGVVDSNLLKEDKQHIYLEFNNLVTGYGWGVTSKGVGEMTGVTILDREIADSVVKFAKADTVGTEISNNIAIKASDLVTYLDSCGVEVKDTSFHMGITDLDDTDGVVAAEFVRAENWEDSTITLSGTGSVEITIQDYYFCTPTTITVTVTERQNEDKFALVFPNTDDYLYRVGNANTVALGSLFKALDGVEIGNVTATVTALNGATVSGTYTANATWTAGTIQFSGTGPVLVTIDDDAYANEKTLYLEVVNATNVTTYSELGNKNSVLLNDITMSSGGSYYLSGATLYGNGFTFDVTDGAYSGTGSVTNNYLVSLTNANLDNVQIVGAVYTAYGAQVADDYNRPTVLSVGNNTITNSYISNCAAPVRVRDGNLEIINSTLKGGNFANLDIRNGHVVLDNVTTINQVNGNDTAEDGTVVVGLGIVIYYENVLSTTTLEIKNGITQYNHLSKTQADTYITDTTAKTLTSEMFDSAYSEVQYSDGSETWVNTGIISMTEGIGDDNISVVDGYTGLNVEVSVPLSGMMKGYVYTATPTANSIVATAPVYTTAGQGAIAPSYSFDYSTKNYVAKTDGSNDYCYEENGIVNLSMDAGDTFDWDTSILTATKNGKTLEYTVSMNGTDYTGKSIAFNTAGNYTVTYSYIDSNNYGVDEEGNITTYSKTYTKSVHISVAVIEASAKNAEFNFGSSNTASKKVTVGNNTYVMPDVTATSSTIGSTTVDGSTIYYPIVEIVMSDGKTSHTSAWYAYFPVFSGVVTIKDYANGGMGDAVTYGSSTTSLPSSLKVVGDPSSLFKYSSSSSAGATPVVKDNILVYSSPSISADRSEYNTVIQYSYKDNAGVTYYYYVGYHAAAQTYSSCVTPDTLVTLADGTQKEIQYVTYEDELLVWNFNTGEYAVKPASALINHGESNYRVISLNFDDGTTVKIIDEHGFFDADANKFVFINEANLEGHVGHSFAKSNGSGYDAVELVSYSVVEEYTTAYSLLTHEYENAFVEGMLSITPMPGVDSEAFFGCMVVGENMTYDFEAIQAYVDKYGLYTYEELAEYGVTYEQFVGANLAYLKIMVGEGIITLEYALHVLTGYVPG